MSDFQIKAHSEYAEVDLDFTRFEEALKKAQFALDVQVMADYEPLMPRQTGGFIQLTHAKSMALAGSGVVCAGVAPMGHFLHTGKVMIDPVTRSPWARAGVTKIYTDRDLRLWYPTATAHWTEVAKQQHKEDWVRLVRQTIMEGV